MQAVLRPSLHAGIPTDALQRLAVVDVVNQQTAPEEPGIVVERLPILEQQVLVRGESLSNHKGVRVAVGRAERVLAVARNLRVGQPPDVFLDVGARRRGSAAAGGTDAAGHDAKTGNATDLARGAIVLRSQEKKMQ